MSTGALIGVIAAAAIVVLIVIILVANKSSQPKHQKICGGCRRVMLPVWTKYLFYD